MLGFLDGLAAGAGFHSGRLPGVRARLERRHCHHAGETLACALHTTAALLSPLLSTPDHDHRRLVQVQEPWERVARADGTVFSDERNAASTRREPGTGV